MTDADLTAAPLSGVCLNVQRPGLIVGEPK